MKCCFETIGAAVFVSRRGYTQPHLLKEGDLQNSSFSRVWQRFLYRGIVGVKVMEIAVVIVVVAVVVVAVAVVVILNPLVFLSRF